MWPASASPTTAVPQPEAGAWDSWYAPRRPPPEDPPPWPAPAGGEQPPPADPDMTRVDGLGPVTSGDLPTAMLGDLRLAPPPASPHRSHVPLLPVIVAAALLSVAAGLIVSWTHYGGTSSSGTTGAGSAASSQAARQAAVGLSELLAQSVTDRAAVIGAVAAVPGCGPSVHQDARILADAASARKRLLSRLGSLDDRALLPAAMLQDLAGAWQASAQADADLARWADDEIARGCHSTSGSDASLRASYVPDGRATADKQAFATLWNPVARRYGLTTYQWSQL